MLEERLSVERRRAAVTRVLLHTETREHSVELPPMALARDVVDVERVPVGRFVEATPEPRVEGDTIVYPVVEEVLVKRLLLREEVRVRKVQHHEEHPARSVVLRSQEAIVERLPLEQDDERHNPQPPASTDRRFARGTDKETSS